MKIKLPLKVEINCEPNKDSIEEALGRKIKAGKLTIKIHENIGFLSEEPSSTRDYGLIIEYWDEKEKCVKEIN